MTDRPRFGVSTAAFFPRPIQETLDILAQQPWRQIELMPQTPAECRPAFAGELRELAAGRFGFCAIHFPQILAPFLYNPYPGAFAYGQALCADLAALAGELGCTIIVVHGPWQKMSTGAFLDATLANLRLLCGSCSRHGVTVALENTVSSPLANSPAAMIDFAAQIDHPNLGFTLDITHAYELGQEPIDYIESLPGIAHVHASDFIPETKQVHAPPGAGVVDWEHLVAALLASGFSGNFVLELLPNTLGSDPVATLRGSTDLLDPLFQA